MVQAGAQADAGERGRRLVAPPPAVEARIDHRQLDIAERVEPVEQIELLEHETDLVAAHGGERVGIEGGDHLAVEPVESRWSGRSRQPMTFMKVDLPEPDGPITATKSPASTESVTSSSAVTVSSPR